MLPSGFRVIDGLRRLPGSDGLGLDVRSRRSEAADQQRQGGRKERFGQMRYRGHLCRSEYIRRDAAAVIVNNGAKLQVWAFYLCPR